MVRGWRFDAADQSSAGSRSVYDYNITGEDSRYIVF